MPKHATTEAVWAYDKLQFARLITEAEAAGVFDQANSGPCPGSAARDSSLALMLASMDMTADQLSQLIDRARQFWDTYKGPELRVLAAPLTPAEAAEVADDDGTIEGVVAVELSTFVDNDLEGVLDALGEALVEGGSCLMGVDYEVVGQQGPTTLYVLVSGDASTILYEDELAAHGAEEADDELECAECGNPMIVLEDDTTRHLIPESCGTDDIDHDRDADHVAYPRRRPRRRDRPRTPHRD